MMFIAGLSAIPADLYEASAIDGAGMHPPVLARHAAAAARHHHHHRHAIHDLDLQLVPHGLHPDQWRPGHRTQILPTLAYEYGIGRTQLGLGAAVLVSVMPVFLVLIVVLTRRMLRDMTLRFPWCESQDRASSPAC